MVNSKGNNKPYSESFLQLDPKIKFPLTQNPKNTRKDQGVFWSPHSRVISPIPSKYKPLAQFSKRKDIVRRRSLLDDRLLRFGDYVCLKNIAEPHGLKCTFQVIKMLADNQETSAYLVREIRTNFIYCLKKCLIQLKDSSEGVVSRLLKEGRIGMKLHHPNIVSTYAMMADSTSIYFLMEFMDNGSLEQHLKGKNMLQ